MAGRQHLHAAEERLRRVIDEAVREVVEHELLVHLRFHRAEREQPLDLGRERERATVVDVDERLDPVAVAAAEQHAAPRVPERERPHPVEAVEAVLAPLLVRVHDDFRVGVRAEAVAVRLELAPQLDEVVDLAVEGDPDRPVLVAERLVSRSREVLDREAARAEHEIAGGRVRLATRRVGSVERQHCVGRVGAAERGCTSGRCLDRDDALVVGPAVTQRSQRVGRPRDVDGRAVARELSDDSAHGAATLSGRYV